MKEGGPPHTQIQSLASVAGLLAAGSHGSEADFPPDVGNTVRNSGFLVKLRDSISWTAGSQAQTSPSGVLSFYSCK